MSVIGTLGKLMKLAAIPVGIANPLLGAGIMGAGVLGDKSDDPGGLAKMKLFKEGIVPVGLTYGGGKLAQGIGNIMKSAAPAASNVSSFAPGAVADATTPVATAAAPAAHSALSSVGNYVLQHPDVALKTVGMGLDAYGASRDSATQRMLIQRQIDEEERQKKMNQMMGANLMPIFSQLMKNAHPIGVV